MYNITYGRSMLSTQEIKNLRSSDIWLDEDLEKVFRAYGTNIELSKAVPCSSLVSRNEAVYWHGELGRFWYKRHYIFERNGYNAQKRFIGFIHRRDTEQLKRLRTKIPHSRIPAIAECYLQAPSRLIQSGYHVLSGNFSSYYGVLPLEVTPLVFPHEMLSGWCAHAAIHTALVLMSDRGTVPLPMFDINWVLSGVDGVSDSNADSEIFEKQPDLYQVMSVLRSQEARGNAIEETFPQFTPFDLATCLTGCIRSRLPVIIGVDFEKWNESVRKYQELPSIKASSPQGNHAVVVIGYHTGRNRQDTRFLVHDSFFGPWIEVDTNGLFSATAAYVSKQGSIENKSLCNAVVALPEDVTIGPFFVAQTAVKHIRSAFDVECTPANLRLTLLPREQLLGTCMMIQRKHLKEIFETLNRDYRRTTHIWRVEFCPDSADVSPLVFFMDANQGVQPNFFSTIKDNEFILEIPSTKEYKAWSLARSLT